LLKNESSYNASRFLSHIGDTTRELGKSLIMGFEIIYVVDQLVSNEAFSVAKLDALEPRYDLWRK
ncbi:hypothetical protein ACLJB6_09275, partial [Campylobacter coli]